MNTPILPKCLSIEVNDVTRSMIRLDQLPFDWASEDSAVPEQALAGLPLTRRNGCGDRTPLDKNVRTQASQNRTSGSTPRSRSNSSSRQGIGNACVCRGVRGVPLGMSRIHPECSDSDPSDRSVAADVLLRQEPDEEEDEEEDEGDDKKDDDDDDKEDDGYSE